MALDPVEAAFVAVPSARQGLAGPIAQLDGAVATDELVALPRELAGEVLVAHRAPIERSYGDKGFSGAPVPTRSTTARSHPDSEASHRGSTLPPEGPLRLGPARNGYSPPYLRAVVVEEMDPSEVARRLADGTSPITLLDVREDWERAQAVIEPSLHIPRLVQ